MSGFLASIVGSFSTGAAGNPTVAIMDAAFASEGLDWRYVNCEVEPGDLADAVAGARAMGWRGFNCSMPHKQAVIVHLSSLSSTARLCEAVNCVVRTGDGWEGHNTDGSGFLASVEAVAPVAGVDALVIGSGGAAHAIAVTLAEAGAATIHVTSRNTATATALAQLVERETAASARLVDWSPALGVPPGVRLVVNATPVGSFPDLEAAVAVDWAAAGPDLVAADVIVDPPTTTFLAAAAEAGATTVDGTGMLVDQAAENIRLWTGTRPDTGPMRAALETAIASSRTATGPEAGTP